MSCATCGGADLVQRPRALTQYSRGTQLSVTSWNQALLCNSCDAAMLARSSEGKPIPPHYQPAAAFNAIPNHRTTPRSSLADQGLIGRSPTGQGL
ncbi:hypothetical protein [Actinomadura sp. 6K520]|uniref:hypothetical protein n=1 Tax=Actinomadura sp. 6K520 TaxID=2530364 RepID=UPI001A9CF277|nr:hypothetical protein [Actinomadura sp. 6K520]